MSNRLLFERFNILTTVMYFAFKYIVLLYCTAFQKMGIQCIGIDLAIMLTVLCLSVQLGNMFQTSKFFLSWLLNKINMIY